MSHWQAEAAGGKLSLPLPLAIAINSTTRHLIAHPSRNTTLPISPRLCFFPPSTHTCLRYCAALQQLWAQVQNLLCTLLHVWLRHLRRSRVVLALRSRPSKNLQIVSEDWLSLTLNMSTQRFPCKLGRFLLLLRLTIQILREKPEQVQSFSKSPLLRIAVSLTENQLSLMWRKNVSKKFVTS